MRGAVKQTRLLDHTKTAARLFQATTADGPISTDRVTLPNGVVLLKWMHPAPGRPFASHCMYDPPPQGVARVIVDGAGLSARDLIVRRHARSGDIGIFATINAALTLIAVLDGIEIDVLRDALRSLP